ncbi:MAG: hypothetical protein H5U06_08960 [Candidatus Aminicenantes bacterium]|nr:hypothetical protein [Candidatus Aminicenantes bacterium]
MGASVITWDDIFGYDEIKQQAKLLADPIKYWQAFEPDVNFDYKNSDKKF